MDAQDDHRMPTVAALFYIISDKLNKLAELFDDDISPVVKNAGLAHIVVFSRRLK